MKIPPAASLPIPARERIRVTAPFACQDPFFGRNTQCGKVCDGIGHSGRHSLRNILKPVRKGRRTAGSRQNVKEPVHVRLFTTNTQDTMFPVTVAKVGKYCLELSSVPDFFQRRVAIICSTSSQRKSMTGPRNRCWGRRRNRAPRVQNGMCCR